MRTMLLDALLVLMVGAAWLGVAGFAQLRTPLDRMHCVTFVNVVAGTALSAAAFASDGVSYRSLTVLFIVALNLFTGAALSHATGRALVQRRGAE